MTTLVIVIIAAVVLIGAGVTLLVRRARGGGDVIAPSHEPAGGAATTIAPPPPPSEVVAPAPEAPPVEEAPVQEAPVEELEPVEAPPAVRPRLRDRLGKTRASLGSALAAVTRRGSVDEETWEELEDALILADVGVPTTTRILTDVRERARAARVSDPSEVVELLRGELQTVLDATNRELSVTPGEVNVWMFVGVNGVGKTTTIAKLAQRESEDGRSIVLAAADTFRAAAAEQLGTWADRVGADLVRGQEGADPGSVVFDAMSAASNRRADLVLVDTAGRLHTKVNLMEELKKLRRIVERTPGALKEVLLVVDASTGQNGLTQARQFAEAVDVTGVVLTKLDGTAKGGIVLAIQSELGIPVKVVGVGEGAEDLVPFEPVEFVDAILG
ncbi:MAG TPA: signal recognition particle-docking protein FtsY [Acidimicrobiia bacterium]|jgi:fused signal recognition particle receptor